LRKIETAKNYTLEELMISRAAKEIRNGEIVLVGTGLPMIASVVAKYTHAPESVMIFESGIIDTNPLHLPISVVDPRIIYSSAACTGLFKALGLLQRGVVDVGFLGGAEIDKYGNINSTVVGDYFTPKVRFTGSGGANDIASLAKRTVIIMRQEKRRFVEKVHYLTSPGYISGKGIREKEELRGKGPIRVITNLAVWGFDEESKTMKLESIHPGVDVDEVRENSNLGIEISGEVPFTEVPTIEEVEIIRKLVGK